MSFERARPVTGGLFAFGVDHRERSTSNESGRSHVAWSTRIHAHAPADGFEVDGLLGLGSLRHFNYEILSAEGRMLAEASSTAA